MTQPSARPTLLETVDRIIDRHVSSCNPTSQPTAPSPQLPPALDANIDYLPPYQFATILEPKRNVSIQPPSEDALAVFFGLRNALIIVGSCVGLVYGICKLIEVVK